jgi:hypothetical protein
MRLETCQTFVVTKVLLLDNLARQGQKFASKASEELHKARWGLTLPGTSERPVRAIELSTSHPDSWRAPPMKTKRKKTKRSTWKRSGCLSGFERCHTGRLRTSKFQIHSLSCQATKKLKPAVSNLLQQSGMVRLCTRALRVTMTIYHHHGKGQALMKSAA